MPTSSPRPCRECRAGLTRARDGLCDPCRAKQHRHYGERRRLGLAANDTYYHSAEWRHLRDEHLRMEPLCRRCRGFSRVVAGYGANHIIPREQGGPDTHANLETLCKPHMTSADSRGVVRRQAAAPPAPAAGVGGGEKSAAESALKRRSAFTHTHDSAGIRPESPNDHNG
jgi:HNH endonuclease